MYVSVCVRGCVFMCVGAPKALLSQQYFNLLRPKIHICAMGQTSRLAASESKRGGRAPSAGPVWLKQQSKAPPGFSVDLKCL